MLFLAAEVAAATEGAKPYVTMHAPSAEDMVFIFWTWVVLAIVIAVAAMGRSGIGIVPKGWAGVFEHIYDWISDLARSMIGDQGRRYVPFVMTLFLFVLASNWIALLPFPNFKIVESGKVGAYDFHVPVAGPWQVGPFTFEGFGLEAPSATLNTTLALALISFTAFTVYGLRRHYERARMGGHGHEHEAATIDPVSAAFKGFMTWLAHFIEPTPTLWNSLEGALKYLLVPALLVLFLGLNIIEEFARIISLTIRLFGNIAGEHQVKIGLFGAMAMFVIAAKQAAATAAVGTVAGSSLLTVLLWGSSVFVTLIGTLAGFIQAFIFMVLSLSYIAHAVVDEH